MWDIRRTLTAIAVVAVAVAAGAVLLAGHRETERAPERASSTASAGVTRYAPEERVDAPPLAGPRLDNGQMDLASLRGDVAVVNVWGSWCPPCREEASALQRVWEETRRDGVRFVGVNTRDTESGATAFVEEFAITYPSIVDPDGEALLAWREVIPVQAVPSTVVIDRKGRVAARAIGPVTYTTLREVVDDIANEGRPPQ